MTVVISHGVRMGTKTRIWCVILVSLSFHTLRAQAHGGPPAVVGVVAAEPNGPSLVVLNEGLALSVDGRWSYLCPSLWGDENLSSGELPLALSVDGRSSWIVGADDLYVLRDGTLTPQGRVDFSAASVSGLAPSGGELFALRFGAMGSEIVELTTGESVWSSAEYWGSFTADAGGFYVARVHNELELVFLVLDRQGEQRAEFRLTTDTPPTRIEIRPTAMGLYVLRHHDSGRRALDVFAEGRWQNVLDGNEPLAGPQTGPDAQLWLSVNGQLNRIAGTVLTPIDDPRFITCLEQWGESAYACADRELYWLDAEGLGTRVFDLIRLSGPYPALVSAEVAERCEFQWLIFRNDLERAGLAPRDWADAQMPPPVEHAGAASSVKRLESGGCRASSSRSFSADLGWVLVGLLVVRHRRRSFSQRQGVEA